MKFITLLLCSLLVFNTSLRLFTNKLSFLPRFFNIIDVFIVFIFVILALAYRLQNSVSIKNKRIFNYLLAFNTVLVLGILFNIEYFYDQAAIGQVIMYNEPIILFLALVNLPLNFQTIDKFKRVLIFLIVLESFIGVMQVPIYLITGETETITGTFSGNAEQYGAFILLGIFFLVGKMKLKFGSNILNSIGILILLILILLIDQKASWLGVLVSFGFILNRMEGLKGLSAIRLKYVFIILVIFCFGLILVMNTSKSIGKFQAISEARDTGNIENLGKIKAYRDIYNAFLENSHMILIGSGPGTFYSRAGYQFYPLFEREMYSNPLKQIEKYRTSNSMGGVITRATREPFFKKFFHEEKIFNIGTGQVDVPFSSYSGLLGETGVLGLSIYMGIYIIVLRKLLLYLKKYQKDSKIFPLIVASVGCIVYTMTVSIYNNWMETGRMTTILWSMIAVIFVYDRLRMKEEELNILVKE